MDASEVTDDLRAMHGRLCQYMKDAPESWWEALRDIDTEICRVLNKARNGRM